MPIQIVDNVSRRLFDGVASVYVRGVRIAVLAGDGRVIVPGGDEPAPVNIAPVLAVIPALSAEVGKPFSFTAVGSDAEGPITWAWTGLPPGIVADGPVISGTPEQAGAVTVTATLTDGGGLSVSRSATLSVAAATAVAPVVTAAPVITGNAAAGSILTLDIGAASGTPTPTATVQWRRAGADIAGATAGTYALAAADAGQAITARVTWTNSAGVATADSNPITAAVAPSLNYDAGALVYYEKGMAVLGSANAVTGVAMRGTGSITMTATGTGADIASGPAGLAFSGGKSLARSGLANLPMGDGIFAVVRVTLNAPPATGTQDILSGSGKYPRILSLSPGTALVVQAVGDSATNAAAGALTYPASLVVGGEMDDVANTLRTLTLDGSITTTPIALTDPSATALSLMKNVNGTLERLAIVVRPEGGAWPLSFDAVVADFRAA